MFYYFNYLNILKYLFVYLKHLYSIVLGKETLPNSVAPRPPQLLQTL